jgi:hypothetical protein
MQFVGNACQYVPQASFLPFVLPYSQFTNQGIPLTSVDGVYAVDLLAANIITPPNNYKVINQIMFDGGQYTSFSNIVWTASDGGTQAALTYLLQMPMLGFKSGYFSMTPAFISTATQIFVNGYLFTANPSVPSSFNASWSRPYVALTANQTINITTPCVFLPKTIGFTISFPTSNSNIASGYYFNPLAYFDSMNCGLLINGVLPPNTTCTVSGGSLTVRNFLSTQITNSTFSIFLRNLRIPPTHLGPINMTWWEGNPAANPFLKTVVNNTNTIGLFCLFANFTYAPTQINLPNLVINFSVLGNLKFPYLPGYYMKIQFIDDWIGNQPINVSLLNKYNQYVETGTATKVNGVFIYTLQTEFLMDAGIWGTLSGFNTPQVDKSYFVITSFWTNTNLPIAQYTNNTITFTA